MIIMDESINARRQIQAQAFSAGNLPTLSFGDSGNAVRILQRLLRANGFPVRVDGTFGVLTEVSVRAFQSQSGLVADGVVGQRTWRTLSN
jgi:peptidoglycan hydrolase-like protein with peptidoglycan-binding domain